MFKKKRYKVWVKNERTQVSDLDSAIQIIVEKGKRE